jgi:hypothetical protein
MWRTAAAWLLFAPALGCAGQAGQSPPPPITATVQIPHDEPAPPAREAPPPRAEPLPPPSEDPYAYYVGQWHGVVNEKLSTELIVTELGAFHVHLPPHPHRPVCDLWGKLRVSPTTVFLDVEHSTCDAESAGTTLERIIVSKSPNELVVRSSDSRMLVHYTRRTD